MSFAVGQGEAGVLLEVATDLAEESTLLNRGEEAHAGGGHKEDGSIGDLVFGDPLQGGVYKRLEVVGTDLSWMVRECRHARADLLGDLKLELGEAPTVLGGRGVFEGLSGILPAINVETRS